LLFCGSPHHRMADQQPFLSDTTPTIPVSVRLARAARRKLSVLWAKFIPGAALGTWRADRGRWRDGTICVCQHFLGSRHGADGALRRATRQEDDCGAAVAASGSMRRVPCSPIARLVIAAAKEASMRPIPEGAEGVFALTVAPEHLANQFKDAALPPVLATPG